jgi:ferredoxin-type protein NapG
MSTDRLDDLPPHGRRRFFAAGMGRLLAPLAEFVQVRLPQVEPRGLLRPPGALPEARFLDTCYRCGRCADACPARAISLLDKTDARTTGTPVVDPDLQACVICDELACMKACPSGALQFVDRYDIRMGLAVVDQQTCIRSQGQECTLCIDKCPLSATAIGLDDYGRIHVIDPAITGRGCTGCGVCQQHCPTRPVRAIRIAPK